MEAGVFGFVDDTHATTTEFVGDDVVGEVLTDHEWAPWVVDGRWGERGKSTNNGKAKK